LKSTCFSVLAEVLSDQQLGDCLAIARSLPDYFSSVGLELLADDLRRDHVYIATRNDLVYGFACVSVRSGMAEILWMAVERSSWGLGIGFSLLNEVSRSLSASGIRILTLKTLAAKAEYLPYERTRQFYERNGFVLLDVIDPYPGWQPGNPCALYAKVLDT